MKNAYYTVVLIYPDYLASNYGEEFFFAEVLADNPKQALKKARSEAVTQNGGSVNEADENYVDPDDFACVALYAGWHDNLNPE